MEVRLLSPALSAAVTTLPLAPVAPVNTATGSNEIDSQAARGFAKSVVQQLHSSGYEAYWAGGCVRDLLVDRTPKDYDVATSARPQQVQELFGEHKTIPLGVSFGIITIVGSAAAGNVEVATFRRDSPYSDGRHPDQVEFSTAEEDALRRDFTINGLFYDPIAEQVIDFVNGRRDIERRVLRAIGDADLRFAEDWLRMLRAVRFTAAFQLEADPTTVAAIRKYSKNILGISSERISAEISRMLIDPHRSTAVQLLQSWQLIEHILPESTRVLGTAAWELGLKVLNLLESPSPAEAIASLIESMVAPEAIADFVGRLKSNWRLSNQLSGDIQWLLESVPILDRLPDLLWSVTQPLVTSSGFGMLYNLTAARWQANHRSLEPLQQLASKRDLPADRLDPPPLITGDDLRQLGWSPGPKFRQTLREIRAAQLDGEISSRNDAIHRAQDIQRNSQMNAPDEDPNG